MRILSTDLQIKDWTTFCNMYHFQISVFNLLVLFLKYIKYLRVLVELLIQCISIHPTSLIANSYLFEFKLLIFSFLELVISNTCKQIKHTSYLTQIQNEQYKLITTLVVLQTLSNTSVTSMNWLNIAKNATLYQYTVLYKYLNLVPQHRTLVIVV